MNPMRKAIILRPGALGDVLAVRGVIRLFKELFPACALGLAAPGERGMFLRRAGWADAWLDWDSSAIAWLFSAAPSNPPETLAAQFAGCGVLCAFMESGGADEQERLRLRLDRLAPGAAVLFCPSRPEAGCGEAIGEWLIRRVWAFLRKRCGAPPECGEAVRRWAAARVRMRVRESESESEAEEGETRARQRVVVLHPGSGGKRKNWPAANYAELGRLLLAERDERGEAVFQEVVVTSGEADGDVGVRVAAGIPGARHVFQPSLERLGRLVAGAALFVGNDSGVSHLAAAVMDESGHIPRQAVIFGPTDAAVWGPPGCLTLQAGEGMDALPAKTALHAMKGLFRGFL